VVPLEPPSDAVRVQAALAQIPVRPPARGFLIEIGKESP
jgi:hypothetical protein